MSRKKSGNSTFTITKKPLITSNQQNERIVQLDKTMKILIMVAENIRCSPDHVLFCLIL